MAYSHTKIFKAVLALAVLASLAPAGFPNAATLRLVDLPAAQPTPMPQPLSLGNDAWRPLGQTQLAVAGDVAHVEAKGERPGCFAEVAVSAQSCNEFRVTMRVSAGSHATLTWAGSLEPDGAKNRGVTVPILPDSQFHTYVFPLTQLVSDTWWGDIHRLALFPSNVAAAVDIKHAELAAVPPLQVPSVTIDNVTHPALLGTQTPWRVQVPANATLEFYIGLGERAWRESASDGARFTATLKDANGTAKPLLDRVLDPSREPADRAWIRAACDLSEFAGQPVDITFSVDNRGDAKGDYAFWGNPIVCAPEQTADLCPIILVSCDTLRADRLSCSGYQRPTTPNLDALAKEAVLFENVYTPEPWTLSAHMTMLTGLYPKNHGANGYANLADSVPTLASLLAKGGYATAGFTGHSWWLLPWRGFARGFDSYSVPATFRNVVQTIAIAKDWVRERRSPFFLFLHNYDIHSLLDGDPARVYVYDPSDPNYRFFSKDVSHPTYQRPGMDTPRFTSFLAAHNDGSLAVTPDEREHMIAGYDDCVRYVDDALGGLFKWLREQGLYDRALIIVTADHGEAFGEHGLYVHHDVYNECCQIPLLIKFPGGKYGGRRVKGLVELGDVAPTVLEVAGIAPSGPMDGHSLCPLLEGARGPVSETYAQRLSFTAVRTLESTYIEDFCTGKREFYDRREDPAEARNAIESAPAVADSLKSRLDRFFEPPAGWHIALANDGTPWKGHVTLTTDDRFDTILSAQRRPQRKVKIISRAAEGSLELSKNLQAENLVVRTASPDARVYLELTSEQPFTAPGESKPVNQFRIALGAQERAGVLEPAAPSPVPAMPALRIWHSGSEAKRSAAKELPQEAIDQLKALGYHE